MYALTHIQTCNKKEVPIALWVEKGLREPQSSGPIADGTGWTTRSNKKTNTYTHSDLHYDIFEKRKIISIILKN